MPAPEPPLSEGADPRVPRWLEALPIGAVAVGLLQLAVFVTTADVWTQMDMWFWTWLPKELGPSWLVALLVALPVVGLLLVQRVGPRHPWAVVGLLTVASALAQHGWAWTEQQGLEGMRDRIIHTGHSTFAMEAVEEDDALALLRDYEARAARRELGKFAPSKPPGTLLVYVFTERLARPFAADATPTARLSALRTLAAIAWPLLAALAVLPLFGLARRLVDTQTALLAALLYTVTPASLLVGLHLDQVLFPGLLGLVGWLLVEAVATPRVRRTVALGVAAGIAFFLGVGCSFVLVVAWPLGVAAATAVVVRQEPSWAGRFARLVLGAGSALATFLVLLLLVRGGLGYDLWAGMKAARAYHERFKGWDPSGRTAVHFGVLDVLEWALWCGLPLALLWSERSWRAVRELAAGQVRGLALLGVAVLGLMVYVALFGHTKGETARLWLPWLPLVCLLGADALQRRARPLPWFGLGVVITLQSLIVWATKAFQDFR